MVNVVRFIFDLIENGFKTVRFCTIARHEEEKKRSVLLVRKRISRTSNKAIG